MKSRRIVQAVLCLAASAGTIHLGSAQSGTGHKTPTGLLRSNRVDTTYRGGLVSPPQAKPEFVLNDTSGNPFDFRKKTEGYLTLLFFGYTKCPDMCPMQMSLIAKALKSTPPDVASQFRVVFVTTDPDRDNPVALRSWLDRFDKQFIGLTGAQRAIDAAQIAVNLAPATKSAVGPDGGYAVGHSTFVFAYTRDNLAHVVYPIGLKLQDWIHDLPYLADETWAKP